ncbi:MAG TPA: ABC transporter permease subunit [Steroidobacteraceae bacterium]|jgi:oligopeptide transport system permease protein
MNALDTGVVEGFWSQALVRLRAQPMTMAAAGLLTAITLTCLLLPLISPYDYFTPHFEMLSRAPMLAGGHLLGTDPLGRDLLVRVMWGCRISLAVGLAASLVSVLIGVAWGAIAGYAGGLTDTLMMRAVDVLYSVPFVPFVIVLMVLFGHELWLIFLAIGAVSWLDIARIVRGQTLSLKQREFIEAARVSGVRGLAMIGRHIVPNLIGIVIVYATLAIPSVILFEAFLSFLGLGVQSPLASLGSLVADGTSEMQAHPHLLIVPAVFLAAIIYCFNYLGDGLRDALDPRDG